MRKMVFVLAAILVLAGSATCAEYWNGLEVDGPTYTVSFYEPWQYSGAIYQYNGATLVYSGTVAWALPQVTVTGATANPIYGVCIDTDEYTGSPMQLRKGWDSPGALVGNNTSRLNGTVIDEAAWNHATYLFSKYQSSISGWGLGSVNAAAFRLATWEVISGDGTGGADWANGNFRAPSVSGAIQTAADQFVLAAFDSGFANWTGGASSYYLHDSQDILVNAPVPEIPTALLAPMGLGMLGLIRRRFAK